MIEKLIDIHNHLIPAFDDGPPDWEVTLAMLRQAAEQGVTDVFATSHFSEYIAPELVEEYFQKFDQLQQKIRKEGISVRVHSGAELFYHPYIAKSIAEVPVATLGNWGQYVLMEFPMFQALEGFEDALFRLSMDDYIPIIAHPERYMAVVNDFEVLYRFVKFGGLLQINGGSILGHFGKDVQKTSMKILEQRLAHFIASDAHTSKKGRSFLLREVVNYLADKVPENYLKQLVYEYPQAIIDRVRLEKMEVPLEIPPKTGFLQRLKKSFRFLG